ncbi:MAG: DUF2971 domain-containing protein [Sedimenticola sp.]|nr:DUF2971 domain-containing protein [Sedimenticola sp.]
MDETHLKALTIFYPRILDSIELVAHQGLRFVQYTSAEAAMSIIKNKEVWLRNVQCMNDYMEVDHGIDCLVAAFNNDTEGVRFKAVMESIFPGIITDIANLFDSWLPYLRSKTYIACVSEHPSSEDEFGRLSMWRAYGGKQPIAIVMNNSAFRSESDALAAYTHPVAYLGTNDFNAEFGLLTERINKERAFVKELTKDKVIAYLFEQFKTFALCLKHPGFFEEREWRVVYNPALKTSDYIRSSIESIDGVPQEIHKIPLNNLPELNLMNIEICELIERIIIGPTDHQSVLGDTFIKLLTESGCKNASERVFYSGIPLRV